MEPKKPNEEQELENWSPESGDTPERERIAAGELSFQEQLGRSACDEPEEEEKKPAEAEKPKQG